MATSPVNYVCYSAEVQSSELARKLRSRLAPGQIAFGVFCELSTAASVEMAGAAGFDFAVVDCEHAPIAEPDLPNYVRAGEAAGLPVLVRVRENNGSLIQQALDAGAAGVQIPQISGAAAARSAVQSGRFHPLGLRGLNPYVRAAGYAAQETAEFLASAAATLLILQLESQNALEQADEILALPGVDVLFVGPYDLSQSLGIPGQVRDARVTEPLTDLARRAPKAGKQMGVYAANLDDARRWIEMGVQYVCFSSDTLLLMKALRETRSQVETLRRYTVSA